MKYEININILSDDIDLLDTLASYAPDKLGAKVWLGNGGEYSLFRNVSREGVPYLSASIRFNETLDRQAAWDFIKSKIKPAILSKILTGSYAKYHLCGHNEGLPCGEPITVWSKKRNKKEGMIMILTDTWNGLNDKWKDMTEEDINRLLKEGVNVVGENKGFQFASSFKCIVEK